MNRKRYKNEHICPDPDMDYREILTLLYKCNFVKNWLYLKIDPEFVDDVQQDVFESLMDKESKIRPLWKKKGLNGVRQYVSGLLARMILDQGQYKRKYYSKKISEVNESNISKVTSSYAATVDAKTDSPMDFIMQGMGLWEEPDYSYIDKQL